MELDNEDELSPVSILVFKRRIRRRLLKKTYERTFYFGQGDIQEQRAVWRLPYLLQNMLKLTEKTFLGKTFLYCFLDLLI